MTVFAEQLKIARQAKNLSQEELATKLYLSRQSISKWETGESSPDLDNLVKLVDILDISLDELVFGKKSEPVIIEKVVEKVEKPMNMWQYLHEESKRPLAVGDVVALIFVTIIILGVYFIVSYFNLFQIRGPF